MIILAERAEAPEEIDRARAERARQRAEQRLSGRQPRLRHDEEIDYTAPWPRSPARWPDSIAAGRVSHQLSPSVAGSRARIVSSVLPSAPGHR